MPRTCNLYEFYEHQISSAFEISISAIQFNIIPLGGSLFVTFRYIVTFSSGVERAKLFVLKSFDLGNMKRTADETYSD